MISQGKEELWLDNNAWGWSLLSPVSMIPYSRSHFNYMTIIQATKQYSLICWKHESQVNDRAAFIT